MTIREQKLRKWVTLPENCSFSMPFSALIFKKQSNHCSQVPALSNNSIQKSIDHQSTGQMSSLGRIRPYCASSGWRTAANAEVAISPTARRCCYSQLTMHQIPSYASNSQEEKRRACKQIPCIFEARKSLWSGQNCKLDEICGYFENGQESGKGPSMGMVHYSLLTTL